MGLALRRAASPRAATTTPATIARAATPPSTIARAIGVHAPAREPRPTRSARAVQLGTSPFDFHWEPPQLGPLFNNDCVPRLSRRQRPRPVADRQRRLHRHQRSAVAALVRVQPRRRRRPMIPGGHVPVPGFGTAAPGSRDGRRCPRSRVDADVDRARRDRTATARRHRCARRTSTSRRRDGNPLPADMRDVVSRGAADDRPRPARGGPRRRRSTRSPIPTTPTATASPAASTWCGTRRRRRRRVGRFGWKANVADARTSRSPARSRTTSGLSNKRVPRARRQRDVSDDQLDRHAFFVVDDRACPAAAPRDAAAYRGRQLFDDFGCASCHIPTLVTGDAAIAAARAPDDPSVHRSAAPRHGRRASPTRAATSSADGRRVAHAARCGASGSRRSSRPAATFLHDGRARTLAEAILWHGGEAQAAREAFRAAAQARSRRVDRVPRDACDIARGWRTMRSGRPRRWRACRPRGARRDDARSASRDRARTAPTSAATSSTASSAAAAWASCTARRHPVIGKRAAIKVLRPDAVEQRRSTIERFIQEARAVNQIGHPNIVDIFDVRHAARRPRATS